MSNYNLREIKSADLIRSLHFHCIWGKSSFVNEMVFYNLWEGLKWYQQIMN